MASSQDSIVDILREIEAQLSDSECGLLAAVKRIHCDLTRLSRRMERLEARIIKQLNLDSNTVAMIRDYGRRYRRGEEPI
jgi:hypothetical protein